MVGGRNFNETLVHYFDRFEKINYTNKFFLTLYIHTICKAYIYLKIKSQKHCPYSHDQTCTLTHFAITPHPLGLLCTRQQPPAAFTAPRRDSAGEIEEN